MKKIFFIAFLFMTFLFSGLKSFAQEEVTEEKSSAWVKVSISEVATKTTVNKSSSSRSSSKKKSTSTASSKKTTPAPKTTSPAVVPKKDDEFNKTNSKVKRFQKN